MDNTEKLRTWGIQHTENWYVVMAANGTGIRYIANNGTPTFDVKSAKRYPSYGAALMAAADATESLRCPAMPKKLAVTYSVDCIPEGDLVDPDDGARRLRPRYAAFLIRFAAETHMISDEDISAFRDAWPSLPLDQRLRLVACMWEIDTSSREYGAGISAAMRCNASVAKNAEMLAKTAEDIRAASKKEM